MASGTADRLDVTAWIPSTRSASNTRSGWESAGIAARSGTSSQDKFGAALSAARSQDDAAATQARVAARRDETAATQSRQSAQRDQADAGRAAAERARTATARAALRDDDRQADAAKLASKPTRSCSDAARADKASGPSGAPVERRAAASASAGKPDTAPPVSRPPQEAAGQESSAEAPSAQSGETEEASTTSQPQQTETTAQGQPVDPTAQPASSDPAAALLALLATLAEGGPVRASGGAIDQTDAEPVDGAAAPAKGVSGKAAHTTAMPDATGTGPAGAVAADRNAPSGIAGPAAPATSGKSAKDAAAAEETAKGPGEAAATAAAVGKDFLAALADAGQGAGQSAGQPLDQAATSGLPQGPASPVAGAQTPVAAPATSAAGAGHAAAAVQAGTSAPADPAIPIGQVPMTIGLRSLGGSNEFQIRLDPVELGRIDVKLEIDKARGTVMTHLVVDRPETLALLQRDAGQLQQALTQAGLDPSSGGLNLSLRSDGGAAGGGSGQPDNAPRGGAQGWLRDQAEAPQEVAPTRWLRGYGGLDIRI